jgi:hypothetical protein
VRAAYRALLHAARPDLADAGRGDGAWLARVQAARDLLLAGAAPDRRRRDRGPSGPPAAYLPLRRATWQADALPERGLDVSL